LETASLETVRFSYDIEIAEAETTLMPEDWDRFRYDCRMCLGSVGLACALWLADRSSPDLCRASWICWTQFLRAHFQKLGRVYTKGLQGHDWGTRRRAIPTAVL